MPSKIVQIMTNQANSTKRVSVNIFHGSIVFLVVVLYPSHASQARIAEKNTENGYVTVQHHGPESSGTMSAMHCDISGSWLCALIAARSAFRRKFMPHVSAFDRLEYSVWCFALITLCQHGEKSARATEWCPLHREHGKPATGLAMAKTIDDYDCMFVCLGPWHQTSNRCQVTLMSEGSVVLQNTLHGL